MFGRRPKTGLGSFLRGVRGDSIASRLARILVWPLVTVVLLLAIVLVRNTGDYATASETSRSVPLALGVQNLVQEIQVERGLTSGLLGGNAGFRDELPPQRKRVDAARAGVARKVDEGARGSDQVLAALRQFESLENTRSQVDSGKAARVATFQYYTDRIAALNGVDFGLDQSPDTRLRRGIAALTALGDYKEQTAQKRAYLNGVFSASGFVAGEYIQFSTVTAAQQAALLQYNRQATGAQQARLAKVLDTGAAREAAYFEGIALAAADGRVIQVNPQSWWSALTTVIDGILEVQRQVGADIQGRADELGSDTRYQLFGVFALALLCVLGGAVVVISATRSITGPLATLATEAEELAAARLPQAVERIQSDPKGGDAPSPTQVPRGASTEIRSVAVALDKVQATAYTLAAEQALMRYNTTQSLANLGRRNQNLIRRQLGFISRLERDETDPGALSNLFELDHLATRMRRNAESLLVLVGESASRTWSQPMPIADVIRAALSEVEEYRRVSLRRIDDGYLTGNFVTGVAHVIAELLENGLTFSPPDLDVEVQGRKVGQDYLIAITDQGVGMDSQELRRANARLRGEENFLLAPAQFLGHYVVGQLAQQMSIEVQIGRSPVTGITARITLPGAVLARPGDGAPTEPAALALAPAAPAAARPSAPEPSGPEYSGPLPAGQRSDPVPAVPTKALPIVSPPVPPSAAREDGANRTRNGLLKRASRRDGARPAATTSAAATRPTHPPVPRSAAAVDRTPDDLRSRLTSLRAGVHRGESAHQATESIPVEGEDKGLDNR